MANYPGWETERRFKPSLLSCVVMDIFIATGMSVDDASEVAQSLVASDQRDIHSHETGQPGPARALRSRNLSFLYRGQTKNLLIAHI